jgi:ABC-type transport system substrate-binding protein
MLINKIHTHVEVPVRRLLWLLLLLCPLKAQIVEDSFARDPGSIDYVRGEGFEAFTLQSLCGDSLVGLSPDGKVVPRLASSWTIQKGVLRFVLRTDATFSDGSAVTAEDARWTLESIQVAEDASPTKRAILAGAQVETQKNALLIKSPKPANRLLMELFRIQIAKKGKPEIGSGPFSAFREKGEWRLSRRNHFLKPKLEGFHFRIIADQNAVLQAMQKGWLSLGVPPPRRLEPPASHRMLTQPMHAQLVVWSKEGPGPLMNLERWRRDAFPAHLLGANAKPSRGLWPESLGFPQMTLKWTNPSSRNLELIYLGGDDTSQKQLLALRERAKKESIDLKLSPLEGGILMQRALKGDFDLAALLVSFDPHPWSVLDYVEPQGAMNFLGWKDPALTSLLPKLDRADAPEWRQIQSLWAKAPKALPLLDYQSVVWVDKHLKVSPSAVGLYFTTPGPAAWSWEP